MLLNIMTDFIRNHLITPVNISKKGTAANSSSQVDFRDALTQAMEANLGEGNEDSSLTENNPFSTLNSRGSASLSPTLDQNMGQALQTYQEVELEKDKAADTFSTNTGNSNENQYDAFIQDAGDKHHIDPNLIHSIIKMESNYNADTKSHAGAAGLMQLMPETAKSLGVTDSLNPKQNIDAGVRYFKDMLKEQNGDISLALAAYNAGPGNVKKHGGIPPFQETQQYVQKVMDHYNTLTS